MNVLLDTHVLLWALSDDPRLPDRYRSAVLEPRNRILVSAASIWEIAIKSARGRLEVDVDEVTTAVETSGFDGLPISSTHAAATCHLPDLHRDPFDRILAAQAITERLHLATLDAQLQAYTEVRVLPA